MQLVAVIFWVGLGILFFCYAGYGLLLFILNGIKGRKKISGISNTDLPEVSLLVAAYNEADILEQKISNSFALDYPGDKIQFVFITDGSTDGSAELIRSFPQITLLHQPQRKGKMAAINRAMQQVTTPVVVFSDANTFLNPGCIKNMVRHYQSPKTGGVAGEKKIAMQKGSRGVGHAEGLYWLYESFMKKQDAGLFTVVGAAGELFSIRSRLFKPVDESVILDDFLISMNVCLQGYTIAYEPSAFATEAPSASLAEEEKRKVRISAGAYQSIHHLTGSMNVFKHPLLAFQFISRRLLRWVVCPILLPLVFFSNLLLAANDDSHVIYTVLLVLQVLFYLMVIPGWWLVKTGKGTGWLVIPFYFVFMNYCLVKGFLKFMKRGHSVLWEKSIRQPAAHSSTST